MATPTIPNGEEYFFPVIYSGNGQGQRVGKFVPFTDNGTIDNSCIFDHVTNAYVSRTPSSNGSGTTLTFSCWIKREPASLGSATYIMFTNDFSANGEVLQFDSSNRLYYYKVTSGWSYVSNRTFEDTSKWYNIVIVRNTNDSTASDRVKIYVDGDRITSFNSSSDPSSGATGFWNQTTYANVVGNSGNGSFVDGAGYLAEVNMVDGTAMDVSTFGVTDTSTGRWIPKTLSGITYGTNGFRLKFQDSSALGDDTSGNTNDFSVNGLTASDQRTDSPSNNIAILRNYDTSIPQTITEGGLRTVVPGSNTGYPIVSTLRPKGSGKFYCEVSPIATPGGYTLAMGVYYQEDLADASGGSNWYPGGSTAPGVGLWIASNYVGYTDAIQQFSESASSFAANDVIGMAADLDNGTLTFYNDDGNVIGGPIGLKNKSICFTAMSNRTGKAYNWNFGDNPTFNGTVTAGGNTDDNGEGNFYHTVPTGFKMLKQDNMAETAKGISGLTWTKNRDGTDWHYLVDSSRGNTKVINPNDTAAEETHQNGVQKFLKGGISVEDRDNVNKSDNSFVNWTWVANSGTTSSNTDGSITSTVQANTTAGFSICRWTAPSSAGKFGHGLSQAPEWIVGKDLGRTTGWFVYHKDVGTGKLFQLNSTAAPSSNSTVYSTAPTSTVVDPGTGLTSASSYGEQVYYCWHGVDGFSKFGKYTGNGNADGPFVYTGFKPAFLLIKNIQRATNWHIYDTQRGTFNPTDKHLYITSAAEVTGAEAIDILSNGFKLRSANAGTNRSAEANIYMAFAEHPFVGDGTSPVTAR